MSGMKISGAKNNLAENDIDGEFAGKMINGAGFWSNVSWVLQLRYEDILSFSKLVPCI